LQENLVRLQEVPLQKVSLPQVVSLLLPFPLDSSLVGDLLAALADVHPAFY
jgi:hypothetical protein